jgi:site-specific recombinase XerD
MSVIKPRPPDEGSRATCRDAIERYLDRSWLLDHTPVEVMNGHHFALSLLDKWLQRHRVVTLTTASANDVRAMFRSSPWDDVSRHCEALLGLVTGFYQSLRECKFRPDDPVETLINQELLAAACESRVSRPFRPEVRAVEFSRSPVA